MPSAPSIDAMFRLLLMQDPEHAILLLDLEGRIIAWQGAAEHVFGYAADEVLGQPDAILFTREDVAKQIPQFELDVARTKGHAHDDRWMLRQDGARFWATGIVAPIEDADGTIVGFGKILRNRTDLKTRFEWLEKQLQGLQHANDRKNTFISTLAHEIRSPLSAMASSLALLNQVGSQEPDSIFARASIRRQLDFVDRLVNDLLEVTRIGAGKVRLRSTLVRLNEVVQAAVETCQSAVDERTHDLQVVLTPGPVIVEGDADRLLQVFINLIQNSIKYTEYGGAIWVTLSVDGADAVVKVRDTGIGISPEMMPRIFDLFTQAEFDTGRSDSGLGIGLSVVRSLVELHGGTVQVRSDGIGRGSEFTVRLPLGGADAARPDEVAGTSQ